MKKMSKISMVVVLGAALYGASFAAGPSHGGGQDRGGGAPSHSAPAPRQQTQRTAPAIRITQTQRTAPAIRTTETQRTAPAIRTTQAERTAAAIRTAQSGWTATPRVSQQSELSHIPNNTFNERRDDSNVKNRNENVVNNRVTVNNNKISYNRTSNNSVFTKNDNRDRQETNNRNDRNSNVWGNNKGNWNHVQHFDGRHDNNWRTGYHWGNREPVFGFGFYLDAPTVDCVVSPWYYYPTMPGYLAETSVVVNPNVVCNWNVGTDYSYAAGDNSMLNLAVEDITAMFQNQSLTALDAMIPPSGTVNVFNNDQYMYSLNDADFRSMMQDNLQNTQTMNFAITGVSVYGGTATVNATHTFSDPDGGTATVYQQYKLQLQNGHYVIVDFSTHQ